MNKQEHACELFNQCQKLLWACTHDNFGKDKGDADGAEAILAMHEMAGRLTQKLNIIINHPDVFFSEQALRSLTESSGTD